MAFSKGPDVAKVYQSMFINVLILSNLGLWIWSFATCVPLMQHSNASNIYWYIGFYETLLSFSTADISNKEAKFYCYQSITTKIRPINKYIYISRIGKYFFSFIVSIMLQLAFRTWNKLNTDQCSQLWYLTMKIRVHDICWEMSKLFKVPNSNLVPTAAPKGR